MEERLRRKGLWWTLTERVGVGGRATAAVLLPDICSAMASTLRPRIVMTDCRLRQSASRSASSWAMLDKRSSKASRWRRSSASKIIFWRNSSERRASISSELISVLKQSCCSIVMKTIASALFLNIRKKKKKGSQAIRIPSGTRRCMRTCVLFLFFYAM